MLLRKSMGLLKLNTSGYFEVEEKVEGVQWRKKDGESCTAGLDYLSRRGR
jgi:hypothetical protein